MPSLPGASPQNSNIACMRIARRDVFFFLVGFCFASLVSYISLDCSDDAGGKSCIQKGCLSPPICPPCSCNSSLDPSPPSRLGLGSRLRTPPRPFDDCTSHRTREVRAVEAVLVTSVSEKTPNCSLRWPHYAPRGTAHALADGLCGPLLRGWHPLVHSTLPLLMDQGIAPFAELTVAALASATPSSVLGTVIPASPLSGRTLHVIMENTKTEIDYVADLLFPVTALSRTALQYHWVTPPLRADEYFLHHFLHSNMTVFSDTAGLSKLSLDAHVLLVCYVQCGLLPFMANHKGIQTLLRQHVGLLLINDEHLAGQRQYHPPHKDARAGALADWFRHYAFVYKQHMSADTSWDYLHGGLGSNWRVAGVPLELSSRPDVKSLRAASSAIIQSPSVSSGCVAASDRPPPRSSSFAFWIPMGFGDQISSLKAKSIDPLASRASKRKFRWSLSAYINSEERHEFAAMMSLAESGSTSRFLNALRMKSSLCGGSGNGSATGRAQSQSRSHHCDHVALPLRADKEPVGPYDYNLFADAKYSGRRAHGHAYVQQLLNSAFVPVPGGTITGAETFRMYEVLEAGAIPIVRRSQRMVVSPRIPLPAVDSWYELPALITSFYENVTLLDSMQEHVYRSYVALKADIRQHLAASIVDSFFGSDKH